MLNRTEQNLRFCGFMQVFDGYSCGSYTCTAFWGLCWVNVDKHIQVDMLLRCAVFLSLHWVFPCQRHRLCRSCIGFRTNKEIFKEDIEAIYHMDNCLYPAGLIAVFYEYKSMVEGFYILFAWFGDCGRAL